MKRNAEFDEFYEKMANGANCSLGGKFYRIGVGGWLDCYTTHAGVTKFYETEFPSDYPYRYGKGIGGHLRYLFENGAAVDFGMENTQLLNDFLNSDDET